MGCVAPCSMSLPYYYYSTTAAARTSHSLGVLGVLDHVIGSARFPSHSAFVAAPGCAGESTGKFPVSRAQPRFKSPNCLGPPALPL